jgi:hypothetical protein
VARSEPLERVSAASVIAVTLKRPRVYHGCRPSTIGVPGSWQTEAVVDGRFLGDPYVSKVRQERAQDADARVKSPPQEFVVDVTHIQVPQKHFVDVCVPQLRQQCRPRWMLAPQANQIHVPCDSVPRVPQAPGHKNMQEMSIR